MFHKEELQLSTKCIPHTFKRHLYNQLNWKYKCIYKELDKHQNETNEPVNLQPEEIEKNKTINAFHVKVYL